MNQSRPIPLLAVAVMLLLSVSGFANVGFEKGALYSIIPQEASGKAIGCTPGGTLGLASHSIMENIGTVRKLAYNQPRIRNGAARGRRTGGAR